MRVEQIENIRKLSNVFCQGVDFEYKYACCTRLATLSTLGSTGLCTAAFVKLTRTGLRIDLSLQLYGYKTHLKSIAIVGSSVQ